MQTYILECVVYCFPESVKQMPYLRGHFLMTSITEYHSGLLLITREKLMTCLCSLPKSLLLIRIFLAIHKVTSLQRARDTTLIPFLWLKLIYQSRLKRIKEKKTYKNIFLFNQEETTFLTDGHQQSPVSSTFLPFIQYNILNLTEGQL